MKTLKPNNTNQESPSEKGLLLVSDDQSLQPQLLSPSSLSTSMMNCPPYKKHYHLESEEDLKTTVKLPRLFSQQENAPQDDESFARYYKNQSNILFAYEGTLGPSQEKRIDLSSNRWFDILALDNLLLQTQVNASSKQFIDSSSVAYNFREQHILLKFICANGPCTTRSNSDIKMACSLAQREIFELRRLLNQALKEDNGIHNLCYEISYYHPWCLKNKLIDEKMHQTMKKFVEEQSMKTKDSDNFQFSRPPKESLKQNNEIRTIYDKVLKKLNNLISQFNKKSFYYIKMLFEDLYYLTSPKKKIFDYKEISLHVGDICKYIEDLVEDFYTNILEEEYSAQAKDDVFAMTNFAALKSMINTQEADLKELWKIGNFVLTSIIRCLRTRLKFKLGYSPSNEATHFVQYLFSSPYSFLMSKIFSHVNWPLLYTLQETFENYAQENVQLKMPELNIMTADLRLTFSPKNLEDTLQKETIPIHLKNDETKVEDSDENKVRKFDSGENANDKQTYQDNFRLMELQLLEFLESNAHKIIAPKLKELRAKYNERFEVSNFDVIIYSSHQYEGSKDEFLLSRIYQKIEQFLAKNFKAVNLKTKSCATQYCFSFKQNKDVSEMSKEEKKPMKKRNKLRPTRIRCISPEFRRSESEPRQITRVKKLAFMENLKIKPNRSSSCELPKERLEKLRKATFRRVKKKTFKRSLPVDNNPMAGQNLFFSYEFIERIALYRSFNLQSRTYFVLGKTLDGEQDDFFKSCVRSMKKVQQALSESQSLRLKP